MKKSFIAMGLAVASTLFFSNCKKVEVASNETSLSKGTPFEIVANTESTKTTNDGLDTKWAEGDKITVFHAENGTTTYGSNDEFTVTGAGATSFSGTLQDGELDNTKSYDWYAFYLYNSYIETPKNTSGGYLNIGSSNSTTAQKQTGNNSKTHLAGKYFPLYGKAENVPATTTPSIIMKQALAVIKVSVTNNTGENLTVANVKFTATEDIVGTYYIDFSGETPVFTKRGDTYVSNVASLDVSNGTAIADEASADFYIAVKPFTATVGSTLKIAVNGYEKSITVPTGGVTFPSGIIKKVAFNYNQVPPQIENGNYVLLALDNDKYYAISKNPNFTSNRRDRVELSDYSGGNSYTTVNSKIIWTVTKAEGGYKINNGNEYFKQGDKIISLVDADNASIISATHNTNGSWEFKCNEKYLAMNGTYGFGFYASGTGEKDIYVVPATHDNTPTLTLNMTSITDVPAAGVTDETEENVYTLENAEDGNVTVTKDGTVVTSASISGGTLTYTVDANSGVARDGWVKLKLGEQEAQIITISQKAYSSSVTYQHVFTVKPTAKSGSIEDGTTTLSGYTWNIASTNLGSYNSGNYAGVQIGKSTAEGNITLTSPSSWSYTQNEKTVTKIKEVRLWVNAGGDGKATASVTIDGNAATPDVTSVTKNSSAGSDWTKATKITFTPASEHDSGVIVINVANVLDKAAYICAIEIEAE